MSHDGAADGVDDLGVEPEVSGRANQLLLPLEMGDEIPESIARYAEGLRPFTEIGGFQSRLPCILDDLVEKELGFFINEGPMVGAANVVVHDLNLLLRSDALEDGVGNFARYVGRECAKQRGTLHARSHGFLNMKCVKSLLEKGLKL
jgi:hypothetical protein